MITVIGDGVFGAFLKALLANSTCEEDLVFLAVPSSAYEEVCSQHMDRHLVNVCSIQEPTNAICFRYSSNVTGIHPMFGPRSPVNNRNCILTHSSLNTIHVTKLLRDVGCDIIAFTPNGFPISGEWHDKLMAKTHLKAISIAHLVKSQIGQDWDIDDKYLPASVRKFKEVLGQLGDMSPGTLSSIMTNPYYHTIKVSK